MSLVLAGLALLSADPPAEPDWREFYTRPDARPGFDQVFSYDPASVRRGRHRIRATLRSWQPMVEDEPVMIGVWRAEMDCARRRGASLRNVYQSYGNGWIDTFGDLTRGVEAALVRTLCTPAHRRGGSR